MSLYTAIGNDVNQNMIFAQQVYVYGNKNDTLLGISTSGNSSNVINAITVAKVLGLTVVGLTGDKGGKMNKYCDYIIEAPGNNSSEIQELHLPIYHTICKILEEELFV